MSKAFKLETRYSYTMTNRWSKSIPDGMRDIVFRRAKKKRTAKGSALPRYDIYELTCKVRGLLVAPFFVFFQTLFQEFNEGVTVEVVPACRSQDVLLEVIVIAATTV